MLDLSELLLYNGTTSINFIVWSLFIGIVIAIIASLFIRIVFGAFVRNLLKNDIDTPEKAVTLKESGFAKNFIVKIGLKQMNSYNNCIVAITEDGKYYSNKQYTDELPKFKNIIIKRKLRKSRIEKLEDKAIKKKAKLIKKHPELFTDEEKDEIKEKIKKEKIVETPIIENNTSDEPIDPHFVPKRVTFKTSNARYFIPQELKARAYSLYDDTQSKIILIIATVILLAIIASSVNKIVTMILDFIKDIIDQINYDNNIV